MLEIRIEREDPGMPDVEILLAEHLAYAMAWSNPEDVYVLDPEEIASDQVDFFTARREGTLLAMGALCPVDDELMEIKSMHTASSHRRMGLGRTILKHLLLVAAQGNHTRVGVETGRGDAFAAARNLYRSEGFQPCPPFGVHQDSVDSICMSLSIG